jgi:hypothetical protein
MFGGYSDTDTFDFVTNTPEIKKKSVLKIPDITKHKVTWVV